MSALLQARCWLVLVALATSSVFAQTLDAGTKTPVFMHLNAPASGIANRPLRVAVGSTTTSLPVDPVLEYSIGGISRDLPITWGATDIVLPVGTVSLVAKYPGDATRQASRSMAVIVRIDPPLPSSPLPTVTSLYDALGNQTKETLTADGGVFVSAKFDALSQPTLVTDALKGVTQLGFDGVGRSVYVADPRTLITEYPRDGLGNAKVESPDTGLSARTFDAAGNLTKLTDARGAVTANTYDASNRLTTTTSTLGAATRVVTFRYDEVRVGSANAGRLSSAETPELTAVYRYDPTGTLLGETRTVKPAAGANAAEVNLSTTYAFSGAHPQSVTYPSGTSVGYTTMQRTVVKLSVTGSKQVPMELLTDLVYEPYGGGLRSWSWVMATTRVTGRRYSDTAGRAMRYPLGTHLRDLAYDEAGNIVSYRHFDSSTSAEVAAFNQSFTSDPLGRLTRFTANGLTTSYTYDANGNRSSESTLGITRVSTIDPSSNRLQGTSNPVEVYGYDAVGNVTSVSGRFSATYDEANRLKTVTRGGVTSTFTYDERGRRVRKVNSTGPASTVLYAYDAEHHLLGEYTATGVPLREYVWLGDVPVAMLVPAPSNTWGFEAYFIHTDHLNAPRVLVDRSGRVRWRWLSDPFGAGLAENNPSGVGAVTFNLRLPGQVFDPETGLHHNFHRDYDPVMGRYIESDPVGLVGGLNTYVYADNAPTRFTDSLGLTTNNKRNKHMECGPLHAPGIPVGPGRWEDPSFKCREGDACFRLKAKRDYLTRMWASHAGWVERFGDTRGCGHAQESDDLLRAVTRCELIIKKKNCDDDCTPPDSFGKWFRERFGSKSTYDPVQERMVTPPAPQLPSPMIPLPGPMPLRMMP